MSTSRRSFLLKSASGLGVAWVTTNYPGILAAQEFVQDAAATGKMPGFAFFTTEQAIEVEAMSAQIIPTDHTAGAMEARVVSFIDRILLTFEKERQSDYTAGLDQLAMQSAKLYPNEDRFSQLDSKQQIEVLTAMETSDFFGLVRTHTITGFFAHPQHGGNFDQIGWELVGYDDALDHRAPFGYYDALPQSSR